MRRVVAAALLASALGRAEGLAQSVDPREQIIDLATLELAHEICGFELSETQEDAIAKHRQALVDNGEIAAGEITSVQEELSASMKRQVPEGLCSPQGAEAKLYRQKLSELGAS